MAKNDVRIAGGERWWCGENYKSLRGYVFDTAAIAMSKPIIAPNIAPDQGLAVMPQVLPAHLPK